MPWLLEMTLLVSVLMVIAHAYIGWRYYRVIQKKELNIWDKVFPFLLILSFYLLPATGLLYYLFWGNPDMLTFSQPMTYWYWFGLVFSAHILTWVIILDLLKLSAHVVSRWNRSVIETWYRRAFITIATFLFFYTALKMIRDTSNIQINETTYASSQVPPALDGARIVHITDIQGDEYTGRKEMARYIAKVNALNPDLVVFTGDLISYGTDFITLAAKELGQVEATYGTYAVVGDHDYWAGVPNVKEAYDAENIRLLQDENTVIPINDDSLLLTGITEVYSKHIPRDTLRLLTDTSMRVKVLATHQGTDRVIERAQKMDYELLLAGHTHGGQLRIPFMFTTFSAAEGDTPYLSGNYHFGDMLMNVDNGLGFTLAPVRYNAPPTISVINLKATN